MKIPPLKNEDSSHEIDKRTIVCVTATISVVMSLLNLLLQLMNSVLKLMNSVLKMMDVAFKATISNAKHVTITLIFLWVRL